MRGTTRPRTSCSGGQLVLGPHAQGDNLRGGDIPSYDNGLQSLNKYPFNPLTTDDAFWRRQILATCYQLAQSILKIGSALAERVGQGVHRSG